VDREIELLLAWRDAWEASWNAVRTSPHDIGAIRAGWAATRDAHDAYVTEYRRSRRLSPEYQGPWLTTRGEALYCVAFQ
jgi:hypothetical protein